MGDIKRRDLLKADIAASIIHHMDRGASTSDVVMALKEVCVETLKGVNDKLVTDSFLVSIKKGMT